MEKTAVKVIPNKNLYIKVYTTYKPKSRKDRLIAHISDIHLVNFNELSQTLSSITDNLFFYKPDMICLTGDLINDAQQIMNDPSRDLFIKWLAAISSIAPLYIVKGNHDLLTKRKNGHGWEYFDSEEYFSKIADLNNVHLLSGNYMKEELDDMVINGFDLGDKTETYYEEGKESESYHSIIVAPKVANLENELDPEQFNILLFHSPEQLYNLSLKDRYSLVLTGHLHNGAVPNYVDKILPGNRGILAPVSGLFPKYARGYTDIQDTTGIIASPVSTIAGQNEKKLVKTLFKPGIQYINVHKNER